MKPNNTMIRKLLQVIADIENVNMAYRLQRQPSGASLDRLRNKDKVIQEAKEILGESQ